MRIRDLAAIVTAVLATQAAPAAAQRTGDRARLVFTVSGAYIQGKGLWDVASQPVPDPPAFVDDFRLSRSIKGTLGAGFSGTYYPGESIGITADAFLIGLGYDDSCRINGTVQSERNRQVCANIDGQDKSAAAVTVSGGAIVRVASREFISPFARVSAGLLLSNQSSVVTQGETNTGVLLVVYDDSKRTRISPAFALGLGATAPMGKGFQLRWEVRDNIVGIERVTGPTSTPRFEPPHERTYKHLFSVLIGVDVVLERQRGRRY